MVTYRRFSHTDSMGYPLLSESKPPLICGYEQETVSITPVVLAQGPGMERAGSSPVPPSISRLKAPTVPAAPDGLPEEFDLCVQENGSFIRHRDTNHKLHGAQVSAGCWDDEETGLRMCRIDVGGDAEMIVPGCTDESVGKDPVPEMACVNIETSTLVAPGSSYDGLVVKIVNEHEIEGVMGASVEHPDLPGGGARVLVCENLEPEKEEAPCCIDEKTGQMNCPESSVLAAYHGMLIPLEYLDCKDSPNGGRICIVQCGISGAPADEVEKFLQHICESTGRRGFPVCEIPGDRPQVDVPRRPPSDTPPPSTRVPPPDTRVPPKKILSPVPAPKRVPVPQLCCYNPETSSLVCEGTPYDGLVVKLVTQARLPNGTEIASVSHPSMPGGGARVPICREGPPQRRPPVRLPPPPEDREEPPPPVRRPPPPPPEDRTPPPPRTPRPEPKLPTPSFLPDNVCYNMITGRLEAEGTKWHGLAVQPISIGAIKDGVGMILVEHPKFVAGRASVPICGGSCYPDSNPERVYGMTYRGTSHKTDGSIRRYDGFSGDPSVIREQREANRFMDERNRSFRPNSPGPNIHLLHQANIPISPRGSVGHAHPPNVTGNTAGYNTKLFETDQQVVDVLAELGYAWEGSGQFEFGRAVRQFQSDYNDMSNSIVSKPRLREVNWVRVPRGHLVADGMVGPVTMNAMEVALVNQRGGLSWEQLMLLSAEAKRGYPAKDHVYDAREKDIGRRHGREPIGPRGISRRR